MSCRCSLRTDTFVTRTVAFPTDRCTHASIPHWSTGTGPGSSIPHWSTGTGPNSSVRTANWTRKYHRRKTKYMDSFFFIYLVIYLVLLTCFVFMALMVGMFSIGEMCVRAVCTYLFSALHLVWPWLIFIHWSWSWMLCWIAMGLVGPVNVYNLEGSLFRKSPCHTFRILFLNFTGVVKLVFLLTFV